MQEAGRVYNFAPGPAALPLDVLKEAQRELVNYKGCGYSILEMSHRGGLFDGILAKTEAGLREIMGIPENYAVLFLQGGASLQFSMIPMNLTIKGKQFTHEVFWPAPKVSNIQARPEAWGSMRMVE